MRKRLIFSHEAASDADYVNQFEDHDEELLPLGCAICEGPLAERDAVRTARGMAHEECAEDFFPYDPGDTRFPR